MRKNLVLMAFVLLSNLIFSQCPIFGDGSGVDALGNITFNNQGQIDYFLEAYPNCTEISGNLIIDGSAGSSATYNINALKNITSIQGDFIISNDLWMSSLSGLESLTYIGGSIHINNTNIIDISALANLTTVDGGIYLTQSNFLDLTPLNNLSSLGGDFKYSGFGITNGNLNLNPNLTNIPGDLNIDFAINYADENDTINITGFSNLTSVGGNIEIGSFLVKDISGLNNIITIGGDLELDEINYLEDLEGFSNLQSIGGDLNFYRCGIKNLNDLSSLISIGGSLYLKGNSKLENIDGLNKITRLNGYITIYGNPVLTNLSGISNIDYNSITNLTIQANDVLSFCQELNICNYLFNGGEYAFGSNAEGCNDFDELIFSCNSMWKNTIKGNVSIDFGSNGCSVNNQPMNNIEVLATNGEFKYKTFTDTNGDYWLFVPEGTYITEIVSSLDYYTPNPISKTSIFSGVGNEDVIDFCVEPIQEIQDVKIKILPLNSPRPGFYHWFKIIYQNIGTTTMNGRIEFAYDESIQTYLYSSNTPSSAIDGSLSWDYYDLKPFDSESIVVRFNVIPPPTVNIGDILNVEAQIEPLIGDFSPENNISTLVETVIGSFDPNDKQVLEGDTILIDDIEKDLNYLVRFQNTGTASAINIKVIDTLESNLDYNTFKLLNTSHAGRVQLSDNVAEFIFDDIYLPDSTSDEPNSHGYVTFSIKPNQNLEIGETIRNKALIYFDYNEPIITNITETYIDADSDGDEVFDSSDNCPFEKNTNQLDSDGDGFGDVCDDEVEVNAPYSIGFDTEYLNSLWRTYEEGSSRSLTSVTISDLYDVDNNGKTIKVHSAYSSYDAMLISPRLNNLSSSSIISFWGRELYNDGSPVYLGFMTNPDDPSTFTLLNYYGPTTEMSEYTLDMTNYVSLMGSNFVVLVKSNTVFIDDFYFSNKLLSIDANEYNLFKLYPNPTSNKLFIKSKISADAISIYDVKGMLLQSMNFEKPNSDIQIDISHLPNGLCFLEIEYDDKIKFLKFIKI